MVIGIDIGGTKIRLGVSKFRHELAHSIKFATPNTYDQTIELMIHAISKLTHGLKPLGVGIVAPGPLDANKGLIKNPKNLPWHNVSIVSDLKKRLGVNVGLGHDATWGGICEARYGAGKNYRSVLYLTISTGIGTSLITDYQPIFSAFNLEGGRQVIAIDQDNVVSFENIASGRAIFNQYGKIAADINDKQIWNDISFWLAVGIYNLITITQPEIVVLGGGVSVHYKKFIRPLSSHINKLSGPHYPLPQIVQARYVETAPLIGSMILAREIS